MTKRKKLPPGVRERNGRYTYRYSVETVINGKTRRKQKETPSFPTAKEAYEAGIKISADRLNGRLVDEKNITLKEWADRWLEDYAIEREPRPTTLRNRTTALKCLFKYIGENTRIKDITTDDYQRYLNKLKLDKYKKASIRDYHSSARLMFTAAVRKGVISTNPAEDAEIPVFKTTLEEIESGGGEVPEFMEKDQLKHFLQVVRFRGSVQEYVIFLLLAYTGLRIGELLALKVSDFDEDEGVLSITKTLTVLKGIKDYHLGPPKNKSSIRKVSIGKTAIMALRSQFALRQQKYDEKLVVHEAGFIFWSLSSPGYPASYTYLEERFKEFIRFAELPENLTPHSLRHTHVSLLAEAGEELVVIQERLGHKNDSITQRVYLHVTKGQRKAVPDKFEHVMNS